MSTVNEVKNDLAQLFVGESSVTGGKSYAELSKKFNEILFNTFTNQDRRKSMFGDGDDFALTSVVDKLVSQEGNFLVDGAGGSDTLLVDNYRVASPSDISIKRHETKDYYVLTIVGFGTDGKKALPREYLIKNFEKIAYVDANGTVQTLALSDNITADGKSGPTLVSATAAPRKNVGIQKLSENNDIAEVYGKGISFNMLGGDDTLRVHELAPKGSTTRPDQVNGGGGNDTIEFTKLTEADIQSITYSAENKNYTLIDKDGGKIQFKNFENIKIGNNIYPIPARGEGKIQLEDMFRDGEVHLSASNNSFLTTTGMVFSAKSDKIVVDQLDALTPQKGALPKIDGGAGDNTLDLSGLEGATSPRVVTENGKTILTFTTGEGANAQTHKIEIKNVQNILIGDKTYRLTDNKLSEVPSEQNTKKEVLTKLEGKNGGKFNWGAETLEPVSLKPTSSTYTTLSLEGAVTDYVFTYEDGSFYIQKDFGDSLSSKLKIENVNVLHFQGSDTKYLLRDVKNKSGSHGLDLKGLPVIAFGTQRNEGAAAQYVGDDIFSGSSNKDILFGYEGNDTFYATEGNDSLDGGEGIDTFFALKERNEYIITKQATGEILVRDIETGDVTTLKNIEKLSLSGEEFNLDNFQFSTVGDNGDNTFTWSGLRTETWDGGGGNDTAVLPPKSKLNNLRYLENTGQYFVEIEGINKDDSVRLYLTNFEYIEIKGVKTKLSPDLFQESIQFTEGDDVITYKSGALEQFWYGKGGNDTAIIPGKQDLSKLSPKYDPDTNTLSLTVDGKDLILDNFEYVIINGKTYKVTDFISQIVNFSPENDVIYWEGKETLTWDGEEGIDTVWLPTGVTMNNVKYDAKTDLFYVEFKGEKLTLKNIERVRIGETTYTLDKTKTPPLSPLLASEKK